MRTFLSTLFLSLWIVLGSQSIDASDRPAPPSSKDAVPLESKVVAALRAYVAQRLSSPESEIDINLLGQSAWNGKTPDLRESESSDREETIEIKEGSQGTLLGRVAFLVMIKRDGEKEASRWITADVGMIRLVVVAVHPIKRLQPIEQTDVTIHPVRLTRPGDRYVVKPEMLIGKRTVRAVGAGTPITQEMVEEAPLIRRGDRVNLVVDIGGLKIITAGQAKEDGFAGRQMAVLNLDSQKTIYGDVVDSSTVRIRFSNE